MALQNYGVSVPGKLLRSAQPEDSDFPFLAKLGVKYILKLNDDAPSWEIAIAQRHMIEVYYKPLPTLINCTANIVYLCEFMHELDGLWLVHCTHGRDRTGLICAAYRLLFCGATLEDVQAERRQYGVEGLVEFVDADMDFILHEIAGMVKT